MAREYIKDRKLPPSNVWHGGNRLKNSRKTVKRVVKGLTIIHIGEDVWKVGQYKNIKNPFKGNPINTGTMIAHRVIYGPNDKEYHLYDEVAKNLNSYYWNYYDEKVSNPHRVNHSAAKVYILTNILDNPVYWCFDLTNKPLPGTILKVIYNNGTIKNIVFDGEFTKVQKQKYIKGGDLILDNQGFIKYDTSVLNTAEYTYMTPIGYRKN